MHANFDFRRLMVAVVLWCGFSSMGLGQVQLQFLNSGAGSTVARVLPWKGGDKLVVGTAPTATVPTRSQINLTLLRGGGLRPLGLGGSGNDVAVDAAIDPAGNLWIVGSTDSDDFALVNPIVATKIAYRTAGFVIELDPTGQQVLFSTYLGGQDAEFGPMPSSRAAAIAIDTSGNAYVGGSTDETDFPSTPGAFSSGKGSVDRFGTFSYAFLVKISPAGKLIYSTELGTGMTTCRLSFSSCIGRTSTRGSVSGLFVDAAGSATVAIEAGAFVGIDHDYVVRVSADGTQLLWSVDIPVGTSRAVTNLRLAPHAGNVDLFGRSVEVSFSYGTSPPLYDHAGLFAAQVKGDGSGFNYMVDLGQADDSAVDGMVVDAAGRALLAGRQHGADWLWGFDASGAALHPALGLPAGTITAPPGIDGSNVLLSGTRGSLLTVQGGYHGESPAVVGFANAASFELNTGVYPGALVTLYGFDLPVAGLSATFDGAAMPILYASPTQINLQVPFGARTGDLRLAGAGGGVTVQVPISQSLGIFTTDGKHAAALNQDGSVNSADNPAAAGSIVSVFGTGAAWPNWAHEGVLAVAAMPLDQQVNRFLVTDGTGSPLNVWYAGTAPGSVTGVFQMNVQLLPGSSSLQVQSLPYTIYSNSVKVYVK